MSFHQDVLEGINAFTAMHHAMKPSPYEEYYAYKLEKERELDKLIKKKQEDWAKSQQQPPTAVAPAVVPPVTTQGINLPNATPGAIATAQLPELSGTGGNYSRGGTVRSFEDGGYLPPMPAGRQPWDERLPTVAWPPPALDPNDPYVRAQIVRSLGTPVEYDAQPHQPGAYGPVVQPDMPVDRVAIQTSTYGPQRKTSAYRDWAERPSDEGEDAAAAREKMGDWNQRMQDRKRSRREVGGKIAEDRSTVFTPRSAEEKLAHDREIAGLEALRSRSAPPDVVYPMRQDELRQPALPPPTGTENLPDVGAIITSGARERDAMPEMAPGPVPTRPPATPTVVPAGVPQPFDDRVPPPRMPDAAVPGQAGYQRTPPPTAGVAPTGNGRSTPGAAGQATPATPPARLPLGDQRRTQAFDPALDLNDPGNRGFVDTTGRRRSPPDIQAAQAQVQKAIDGGIHFASYMTRQGEDHPHSERDQLALYSGVGAMPAPVAANVYKAWSEGGRSTPAEALIRYMVFKHEALSELGRTAEANQMAFEVLQRLNLEAAKAGQQAMTLVQSGNIPAAAAAVARGHAFTPDGKELAISKDGTTGVVRDEYTGAVTAGPFQLTPQFLLAQAMHMSDGRMFWNHLAQRAAMFQQSMKGTDKDAEGRAIRNENNRLRGEILRQRLAGGIGGGRGGRGRGRGSGGGTPSDPNYDAFNSIWYKNQPTGGGSHTTTIINEGSDDDGIMRDDQE